jgi:hypothetical protein
MIFEALKFLEQYGFSEKDFIEEKERRQPEYGNKSPDADIIWFFFNKAADRAVIKNRASVINRKYRDLSAIYMEMAVFLNREGKRGYGRILKLSYEAKLKDLYCLGIEKVKIVLCENPCKACAEYSGKIISVEEDLCLMPIPADVCERMQTNKDNYCECDYAAIKET